MKILIAGAGIGGLCTALSLHREGFDVQIFESAREIKPLGVGINLLPHAVRVLTNLGLDSELGKTAVATSELVYYNKFGQKIWQEQRGKYAGYKWPQYSIHRGVLQMILLEAVKKALGAEHVHTGYVLQAFKNENDGAQAYFLKRDTNEFNAPVGGDILIGADGIHSIVRKQFYPGEGMPNFSGILLHRGVTKTKPFLSGSSMIMAGHSQQKFVAYPISPELDEQGLQLINWIADLRATDATTIPVQDWNRQSDKDKLISAFKDWTFDWLDVPSIIDGAEAVYEFPMSDRDPIEKWSFGRITLLGDAAHPMYPIGSNGASQAILDSESITKALKLHTDPVEALKQYENDRLPPTSTIVLQNRKMGPEQVMQLAEERAPEGFTNIHNVISKEELESIAAHYKKLAGFDKNLLNQKQ